MTKSHSTSGTLIKDSWDVVAGVILLGFALLLLFYLIPNYIGQPPIMQNPMMSPRWLPTIVGWLLLVFSLLMIVQGVLVADDAEDSGRSSSAYFMGLQSSHRLPCRHYATVYRGHERTAADVAVLNQRPSLKIW